MKVKNIPKPGDTGEDVKVLQKALKEAGFGPGPIDGVFGSKTKQACSRFQLYKGLRGSGTPGQETLALLGIQIQITLPIEPPKPNTTDVVKPVYPKEHPFHPRFAVRAPYTHIHPMDVLRSVEGEKEIPGKEDNPLIAHFHEHSGNLGKHDDHNDYADEVPHCSSALNWAADMAGCEKTNNARAASWEKYGEAREGEMVEVGDIIVKRTGSQNHVTLCAVPFNIKKAKTFKGFGSNQGNTIKTSTYQVSDIRAVRKWKPLPGTVLAPIGYLGSKPKPVQEDQVNESTR